MSSQSDSDEPIMAKKKMSPMDARFLDGAWPEAMNMCDPIINVLVFYAGAAPSVDVLATAVETHLWPSHRFSCCMEDGYWVAKQEHMDRSYHFQEQDVADEAAIDAFVQVAMLETLDLSFPAWRVKVLRARSGRSAVFMRLHHSIGDGISLLFAMKPLMGCPEGADPLTKIPLPGPLLPPSARKPKTQDASPSEAKKTKPASCCGSCPVGSFCRGMTSPLTSRADDELSINAPLAERTPFLRFNGNRSYGRFPCVPMSAVSAARKLHGCSVNDVLLAALTGALRRFAVEVLKDRKLQAGDGVREFKSMMMMALPRKVDEEDLLASMCNKVLFASCPLPIDEEDAAERVRRTVEAVSDLKSVSYMTGLMGFTNFASGVAPLCLLRKAASEVFSKHTLLVSNVPATTVPITFPKEGGEQVDEIQMVFPNCITQVSFITYNGKVCANIIADPALFPDLDALGRFWESEINSLGGSTA